MIHKHIKALRLIIILLFTTIAFNSCKVLNPSAMFKTESEFNFNDFEEAESEYVIRPYDKLDVRIYTNDGIQLIDMESSSQAQRTNRSISPYMVEHDGLVKLPTIGRIKVSGLTIKETEKLLEEKYSQFYQKPFVLVNVTNRRIVIFTAGSTAGTVLEFENEQFTLVEALARAGGINDFSKAYQIKLLRGDLSDPQVHIIDISSVEDMKNANLVLQANDVIYVEKRPRYAARTLGEIMPYITLFNTFVLLYVTIQTLN